MRGGTAIPRRASEREEELIDALFAAPVGRDDLEKDMETAAPGADNDDEDGGGANDDDDDDDDEYGDLDPSAEGSAAEDSDVDGSAGTQDDENEDEDEDEEAAEEPRKKAVRWAKYPGEAGFRMVDEDEEKDEDDDDNEAASPSRSPFRRSAGGYTRVPDGERRRRPEGGEERPATLRQAAGAIVKSSKECQ
jgi:hypothetical protein